MTTRCGTPVTVTRDVQPIVPDLRMDHVVEEHFPFVLAPCSRDGLCHNATQRHTAWAVCRWCGSRRVLDARGGVPVGACRLGLLVQLGEPRVVETRPCGEAVVSGTGAAEDADKGDDCQRHGAFERP